MNSAGNFKLNWETNGIDILMFNLLCFIIDQLINIFFY